MSFRICTSTRLSSKSLRQKTNASSPKMAPIYLDYNATTPLAPEVCASLGSLLQVEGNPAAVLAPELAWGNPSSGHVYGTSAKTKLETARAKVAEAIGAAEPQEILFLSGGTESINHAIQGALWCSRFEFQDRKKQGEAKPDPGQEANHVVTSAVEHVAVSDTIKYLVDRHGFSSTTVPVDEKCRVSTQDVVQAVTEKTVLVTIMLANNEVGSIQPIKEIVQAIRQSPHGQRVLIHTDASQAIGKIPVDVQDLGVDMMTLAGHKIYGPKGIGALYIRRGVETRLCKFMHGAGHERGLRAGTENVLLATGLGRACELVQNNISEEVEFYSSLRDSLQQAILSKCQDLGIETCVNGHPQERLPNTLSISFRGIQSPDILARLAGQVSCSAGAACHTGGVSTSHVLRAMNLDAEFAVGTLRLSVGRYTKPEDVAQAAVAITDAVQALANVKVDSESPSTGCIPTKLKYMEDTHCFEAIAHVIDVVEKLQDAKDPDTAVIVLDETIFHPQGGGQPADVGEIIDAATGARFIVMHVEKEAGVVKHLGKFADSTQVIQAGCKVHLRIDEQKRRFHARIHSAGHLIDQAMRLAGCSLRPTKGFHFPSGPSVDYEGALSAEERATLQSSLQEYVNGLVQQAIPTRVFETTNAEAAAHCLEGLAPPADENPDAEIRMVIVGGALGCPCGGTHVKNSSEIGPIHIRKLQNKKGNLRISYVVEEQ